MKIIRHVKERDSGFIGSVEELRHSTVKEMNKIKAICEILEIATLKSMSTFL